VLPVHNGRLAVTPPTVPQGDFVFTASRLWDEGKNVTTLDAAAQLTNVPFNAAGPIEGPNGARVSFEHLRLVGELDSARLSGVFAARPIYASAAVYEPFGLSVLEAAHAGCALVLSDIPTFRELWRDSAWFVPARSAEGYAAAVNELMGKPAERERLGRAARSRAQLYTPARMAEKMAAIYAAVTAKHASVPHIELEGAA
jgi:glycosyltransferase involved in cell wall biosynthesis